MKAVFGLWGKSAASQRAHASAPPRLFRNTKRSTVERLGIQLFDDSEFVSAEAHNLDVQIVVDEINFLLQGYECIAAVEQSAEDRRQFDNQLASSVGTYPHERRHRIQGIKKKMRID